MSSVRRADRRIVTLAYDPVAGWSLQYDHRRSRWCRYRFVSDRTRRMFPRPADAFRRSLNSEPPRAVFHTLMREVMSRGLVP